MEIYVVKGEWYTYNNGPGSEVELFETLEKAQERLEKFFQEIIADFEEDPRIIEANENKFCIEFENACCFYWYAIEKQKVF